MSTGTMPKFIYTIGLPGAGKSTWAKDQQVKDPNMARVNRDDLRAMLWGGWTKTNEKTTIAVRNFAIMQSLTRGLNTICDDTNLSPKSVEALLAPIRQIVNVTIESKSFLDVPLHVCIARDEKRTNPVGASVIRDMFTKFVKPNLQLQNGLLEEVVICDLDGTIAQLNGRDPYDASTSDQDGVNKAVVSVLDGFIENGVFPIFVSGREEKDREPTKRFLTALGYGKYALFMRPTGDTRDDTVVKYEIYEREIKNKYYVKLVLDDRDKVVDMWRGLGFETWQVGYGTF